MPGRPEPRVYYSDHPLSEVDLDAYPVGSIVLMKPETPPGPDGEPRQDPRLYPVRIYRAANGRKKRKSVLLDMSRYIPEDGLAAL